MNFTSTRLGFRLFRKEDFQLFYSLFSNEQVMRYAWLEKVESEEEARSLFEDFISNGEEPSKNNSYSFAVFQKENGEFIGFADIQVQISNAFGGFGEIGYFLLPEYWGKGYATELVKTLIGVGFTKLNFHKMSAACNSNNLNSEAVMKKAGMVKEGELRKVRFKNGKWDDEKHYGILIDEWKERSFHFERS